MRATFAIAALAGSAVAFPGYGYQPKPEVKEVKNVHVVVETVVHTVYVTEGAEVPQPTPTPEPVYEAPAETTTVVYEEPKSEYVEYKPTPTPTPTPTPAPSSAAPATPSSTGYMAVVDKWRAKMGMKALTWDATLEANALDVVVSSDGSMVHKLNPGTNAQVLAPEIEDNGFEKAFVGGWLCEIPTLPGLEGVCEEMGSGYAYEGQTGHAKILTSPDYSKIACAVHKKIWCCDLS